MFDERVSLVYTLSMRYVFLAIAFVFVFAVASEAAIYRWVDKDGVLHVTDDEFKVPEKYRKDMTVIEEEEPAPPSVEAPVKTAPERLDQADEEELYGDHTLRWWRSEIKRRKEDVAKSETDYNMRKQFVEVFERGRSWGRTFEQSEVDTYNEYKNEIPELENLVKKLKEELEDIKDKARRAGVPKKDRGE